MSALDVVVLVLGIIVAVALLLALIMIPIRRRAHRLRDTLRSELGEGVLRMDNVQGFGLQSAGKTQVRGNGWLSLTADELVFLQWVPQRDTRIRRADIVSVETPRSWLGKTNGSKLLCVRWRTPDGPEDAMAWYARELDAWLAALGQRPPDRAGGG